MMQGGGEVETETMSIWGVKRSNERVAWDFVPFVSVGPLRFGTGHDEVTDALGGVTPDSGKKDGRTDHRTQSRYHKLGVRLYYRERHLYCIAIDGLHDPQVTFDETELTGRAPSAVEQWMIDHARFRGLQLRIGPTGDPLLVELGLIFRVQRAGDVVVSRPMFLDHESEDVSEDVPEEEWSFSC